MNRSYMNRSSASLAIAAALALGGGASIAPARAAPPTVTPTPGYDARLQQRTTAPVIYAPAAPAPQPVLRRHKKHRHDSAH